MCITEISSMNIKFHQVEVKITHFFSSSDMNARSPYPTLNEKSFVCLLNVITYMYKHKDKKYFSTHNYCIMLFTVIRSQEIHYVKYLHNNLQKIHTFFWGKGLFLPKSTLLTTLGGSASDPLTFSNSTCC